MQITEKIVCTAEDEHREEAKELASRLDIPFAAADAFSEDCDEILQLRVDERGLSMARGGMRLQCDLTKLLPRLRYNNLTHELVVRAAKNKDMQNSPFAIDATAGFGEDALLLAAAGFTVEMYEKDRIIAALLEDGLRRAARITARMHLHKEDSIPAMRRAGISDVPGQGTAVSGYETAAHAMGPVLRPNIVLLDPMFPERSGSSQVRKKFQLIHCIEQPCDEEEELLDAAFAAAPRKILVKRIEQPCDEEEELLDAAFAAAPRKILVKRPLKGAYLAGRTPSYSIRGKAVRYDCFVLTTCTK